jgi:apolipoprotein D and lipocalin family protein
MKRLLFRSLLLLLSITANAQNSSVSPLSVVPSVDLPRYAGTWYEIARLPNWFQKQCAGEVTAEYTLLEDGSIQVINRCRKANGEMTEAEGRAIRASSEGPNTKLKVRFAPGFLSFLSFVWGNYWIIDLAPDYTYAVIGEPSRKYLWILSRTPELDESTLQMLMDQIRLKGYNLDSLVRTNQNSR